MKQKITLKTIVEEISMLGPDQVKDVMAYVNHLKEIESMSYEDPKEYARIQIRRALENGFSF